MPVIPEFASSHNTKQSLTIAQQKRIAKLYKDLSKDTELSLFKLRAKANPTWSDTQRMAYLKDLVYKLSIKSSAITKAIERDIPLSMSMMVDTVKGADISYSKRLGIDIKEAYSGLNDEVVGSILTGKVYDSKFNFSKSIWSTDKNIAKDLNTIVAKGVAAQKSTLDIAKDLESYVDPSAKKAWDWSKVYPGVSTKIDYNAQRLARTLEQHAYQVSLTRVASANPFIDEITWHSAFAHGRTCAICRDRDGTSYAPSKLPLDHPNGLCYFSVDGPPLSSIADRIANWANGGGDAEIDKYVKVLSKQ